LKENNIFGTQYGNWAVLPIEKINESTVFYSFGAGEDISYEVILSGKKNPEVHIFDPTPRAIEHYKFCVNLLQNKIFPSYNPRHGGGDPNYNFMIRHSMANMKKIIFHSYGIYDKDSEMHFFHPKIEEHVSLSIHNLQNSNNSIKLKTKKIDTIMNTLGHNKVDIIKMNIEGAELESLLYMFKETEIRPHCMAIKLECLLRKDSETLKKISDLNNYMDRHYSLYYRDISSYNYTYVRKGI
jgi:FkbM family methyltransferase